MRCRLRKIHNNKSWLVVKNLTSLGKDNCDITVKCKQSVVDRKHAFISVDEEKQVFTISDNNSSHGTYVNDHRIQSTNVHLKHGDVIRLGHAGPRFEVILEDTRTEVNTTMSNLPTLPTMPSSPSLYPGGHYGRYTGFASPTRQDKSNVVPHPPVRQRPVSANPSNGVFQPASKPTISGNWTNGFTNGDDPSLKTFDPVIDFETRIHKTDDKLAPSMNFETECHKKESVIDTLREEIDYLRRCMGGNQSNAFATGCHQKIAALHNQVEIKTDDNNNLRAENEHLRTENDSLRQQNEGLRFEKDIRVDIDKLRNENERLKNSAHDVGRQVSEMKILVTQRDHKVALLENELNRVNKEKSQMTVLLNSLQKEITSKDENIKKAKDDVEKYKVEMRNKNNEISAMAARLSKNTELKETIKGLKQKEEEASHLKYRMKSLDDKISAKDMHIQELHDRISEADIKIAESENDYNIKLDNFRCQVKMLEEKVCAKEAAVQDLNLKLSETRMALSEKENQLFESSSNEIEATKYLSGILCEIENNLIENGRSCKSLNDEINRLQCFDAPDTVRWVKECFLSYLCEESNWERDIEDALKLVTGDSERAATPPTLLIQILHEKLEKNLKEITSLEDKINSVEHEHIKYIEDVKSNIKEKYKQKAEKAIKEMRSEEKQVHENEIQKIREEEGKRIAEALESQRVEFEKDASSIEALTEDILALQEERNKMANDIELLQRDLEQAQKGENDFKEKLDEIEAKRKISEVVLQNKVKETASNRNELAEKLKSLEETCNSLRESNELKSFEIDEMKPFKEKAKEQLRTITSLEYQITSLKQSKGSMEEKLETLNKHLKEYQQKEEKLKREEANANSLAKEIEELINMNGELKKIAEEAQKECNEEKLKTKTLQEDLDTALANLSDLKGDLSDKEKQRIEYLEEKCSKQEKELLDQQMHLVKLSTLVDEQKKTLLEQKQRLEEQKEMLVDRHIPWALKDPRSSDVVSDDSPTDLKVVGERCIGKRHDQIISEQKNVIQDMRRSLSSVDKLALAGVTTHHPQQIVKMSNAIDDLKDELAVQEHQSAVTDQELYDEVCRLQSLLVSANEELSLEQLGHKSNLHALEQCEELYLKFVHDTNKELDIPQILGAKPVSFAPDDERARIMTERGKGLEIIVNRIRSLKSRIERKDQLLEHYDDDLKNLRDTENFAGKKSFEVNNLQKELTECKNEISYLQEALKKWRGECDDLKRQNNSLKQKKVLMMDFNGSNSSQKTKRQKSRPKQLTTFGHSEEVVQDI